MKTAQDLENEAMSADAATKAEQADGSAAESAKAPSNEIAREEGQIWGTAQTGEEDLERIAKEMDTPAKKFARWPEDKRKWFERAIGLALGAGAGCALTFIPSGDSFLSMGVIIALLLAMIVPRIIENKLQTQLRTMKRYLLVALAAYIVITAIIAFTSGAPIFAQ